MSGVKFLEGTQRSTGNPCGTIPRGHTVLWDNRDPAREDRFHWTRELRTVETLEGLYLSSSGKIDLK